MSSADLEAWLDYAVGQPEPDPELADQLTSGRLTTRALYLLLFEARGQGWARHRAIAWDTLVAAPAQAPGVLSMVTQAGFWAPAAYLELGEGTAQCEERASASPAAQASGCAALAYVTTPDGPVVGEPVAAGSGRPVP